MRNVQLILGKKKKYVFTIFCGKKSESIQTFFGTRLQKKTKKEKKDRETDRQIDRKTTKKRKIKF
jgi:hypothetical protein